MKRLSQVAAGQRAELLCIDVVVGLASPSHLLDLVLQAQAPEEVMGLGQRAGVASVEGAGGRGRAQALAGGSRANAGRHAGIAGDPDDGKQAPVLDVELAPVLAGAIDDEVAWRGAKSSKARRRPVGEGEPQHEAKQGWAVPGLGELVERVSGVSDRMDGTGVEKERQEDQRLVSIRMLDRAADQLTPGIERTIEKGLRRGRTVGVGREAARRQLAHHAGAEGLHVLLLLLPVSVPDE